MAPWCRALAIMLLLGYSSGCAGHGFVPAPGPGPDPFRLVILDSSRHVWPDGDVMAFMKARIEMADGTAFPEGRWFFEGARLGEAVVVGEERRSTIGEVVGMPSGFSSEITLQVGGLRPEDAAIRRLAVDVPMLEILEGVSEELTIADGQRVQRRMGPDYVELIGDEAAVLLYYSSQGEEIPEEPFYAPYTARSREHAWSMTDARGRALVDCGGGGDNVLSQTWYRTGTGEHAAVEFPVRLAWRIPRKWRVTLQRFVLEDVVLGPFRE